MSEAGNSTPADPKGIGEYTRRVLIAVGLIAAVVILLLFLWSIATTFLVIFGGILLAILLRSMSNQVSSYTSLSNGWALAIVGVGLIGLMGLAGWLLAPDVIDQFDRLIEEIPKAIDRLEEFIRESEQGRQILETMPGGSQLLPNGSMLVSQAGRLFSTTMGKVTNLLIIAFTGIYLSVEPQLYRNGLLRLMPRSKRQWVSQVLDELVHTLRRWLVGRLISMFIIGILTTFGFWLLGIPVALSLGLFAGAATFVPYIGPIISVIPAILLALVQGPTMVLYVLLLYLGIQLIESYFLTPLIQQEAVSVPPVLTITGQVGLGVIFGTAGVNLCHAPDGSYDGLCQKILY